MHWLKTKARSTPSLAQLLSLAAQAASAAFLVLRIQIRDHGNPKGVNHGNPKGVNHGNPKGVNHGNPKGVNHGNPKGVNHAQSA